MKISVTRDGWEDYITWSNEPTILKRIHKAGHLLEIHRQLLPRVSSA
ncbi:MAG TPA: hypothetical protein VJT72_20675 [Pseudonocardiaceae bacterium]|nr:hypothetical protein [Pseudonocardiaceae bacterium]